LIELLLDSKGTSYSLHWVVVPVFNSLVWANL